MFPSEIRLNGRLVATSTLGLWPKLKNEKGDRLRIVFEIQTHSHKCEKVQESESHHSQLDSHLGG